MKIDILAQADKRTGEFEKTFRFAADALKIQAQITRTSNFAAFSHLAINPSQTPIVIIDGNVEFAGRIPDLDTVKNRLNQIRARGGGY